MRLKTARSLTLPYKPVLSKVGELRKRCNRRDAKSAEKRKNLPRMARIVRRRKKPKILPIVGIGAGCRAAEAEPNPEPQNKIETQRHRGGNPADPQLNRQNHVRTESCVWLLCSAQNARKE